MYKFRILLCYRVFWYIVISNKIKYVCVCLCVCKCVVLCWGCSVSGLCPECVLCSLCCVLCCSLCSLVCAAYIFVCLFLFLCVYLYSLQVYADICMCIVRMYVRMYVREVFGWGCVQPQSDTPLYGCLCGYRVRIIKAKKTQP